MLRAYTSRERKLAVCMHAPHTITTNPDRELALAARTPLRAPCSRYRFLKPTTSPAVADAADGSDPVMKSLNDAVCAAR